MRNSSIFPQETSAIYSAEWWWLQHYSFSFHNAMLWMPISIERNDIFGIPKRDSGKLGKTLKDEEDKNKKSRRGKMENSTQHSITKYWILWEKGKTKQYSGNKLSLELYRNSKAIFLHFILLTRMTLSIENKAKKHKYPWFSSKTTFSSYTSMH